MKMPFEPKSFTLNDLFNREVLYNIPSYQRPYQWTKEQVVQLWEDLFEAYENDNENYFLGSIITMKSSEYSSNCRDVVDGQQRLITLIILFAVIRDNFSLDEENSPLDTNSINSLILMSSQISKLSIHRNHSSDFFRTIIENGATININKPSNYELKNEQAPLYKFRNTAIIFKNCLLGLQDDRLEGFMDYILNKVLIITIDCLNKDFAVKLFQVLNDRGLALAHSDLIKSYLIDRLHSLNANNQVVLKVEEECLVSDWEKIESIIGEVDINLNELFTIYLYYSSGVYPKKSLLDEIQDLFKDKDPRIVVSDLYEFANEYKQKIFYSNSKVIYSFRYSRWSIYWKAIAMTALVKQVDYYEDLLIELRRFYYLSWLAGKTVTQVKYVFFSVIKAIKSKSINYIKAIFRNNIAEYNLVALTKENLKTNVVDKKSWIKPLLLMLEYESTDNSVTNFIPLAKELHLEHILPKKYYQYKNWGHITDDINKKWIGSVANLTLLDGIKNSDASNLPFSEKMGVYLGRNSKNTNTTSFRISQHILDDFNNNKFNNQWNEKALKDRWQWFFTRVENLLNIDCGDLKEIGEPQQ